jgi:hypothetical protein
MTRVRPRRTVPVALLGYDDLELVLLCLKQFADLTP